MSNFSTNLVRFVLKLANVLLLLLGISMGLYALSTFEEYKKLKTASAKEVPPPAYN